MSAGKDEIIDGDAADDAKILSDMGYSQELLRGVTGSFMNFAFTFTAVSFISSYSILFGSGLITGGPVVMTWGWFIGSIFSIGVGFSMAEICSAYPSAGSVYHWAGQLAKKERAPFISFICGWFNFLGNVAGDASFASGFSLIVAAAAALNGYEMSVGEGVAVSIAVLTVWSVMNIARIDQQGIVNNIAAIYQVLSSFVIIIVVLAMAPERASASFVFGSYNNGIGLDGNDGYVVLIGLLSCLFAFSGYEAGGHIAEETKGAKRAAPKGIIYCVISVAIVGWVYVIGLLFATPSIDGILNGGSSAAVVNVYVSACGHAGGLALTILLIFNLFFAGISSVTVTSRITFALARDGAFPGSQHIRGVSVKTKAPMKTVFLVYILDALLLLLPLANSTAFTAIVSLTTIGFQMSYAIPIWCRVIDARNDFKQSDIGLGRLSIPLGWISASWLTLTSLLFFWPPLFPVDQNNMNYTVVVVGGVLIIALIYWFVAARKFFRGPKRMDEEIIERNQEINVDIEAEDETSQSRVELDRFELDSNVSTSGEN